MIERIVAVAYSGGRDSTALLHATLAAAAPLSVQVLALHVHHGLSPNADAWLAHCDAQCALWKRRGHPLAFAARRLAIQPVRGESVEAWARDARYAALAEMALAHGARIVLLAQHRRDQAETFLLQALRGGGVAGLAGMPRRIARAGIIWQRPWLDWPREAIEAYGRRHRLRFVSDESNDDPRFARNRLRRHVWPVLTAAFPATETTLAAAAAWSRQAAQALEELAALDLARVADARGLDVVAWCALSDARRSNALRAWLKGRLGAAVPATLTTRLLTELPRATSARWPLAESELRLHRGRLECVASALRSSDAAAPHRSVARETALSIRRAGRYALPGWGGNLLVERVTEDGVPLAWLAHLQLRARAGAESFQAAIGRPPRSLKKQYQAAGLPAWQREGPLVFSGGQLVFVPGLGLDARVIGLPGTALVNLDWQALDAAQ
ncbi:MAG: tRNA lysidine(34) synthetase TilS [Burkholderiaceae bacterium]